MRPGPLETYLPEKKKKAKNQNRKAFTFFKCPPSAGSKGAVGRGFGD